MLLIQLKDEKGDTLDEQDHSDPAGDTSRATHHRR